MLNVPLMAWPPGDDLQLITGSWTNCHQAINAHGPVAFQDIILTPYFSSVIPKNYARQTVSILCLSYRLEENASKQDIHSRF